MHVQQTVSSRFFAPLIHGSCFDKTGPSIAGQSKDLRVVNRVEKDETQLPR